MKYHVYADESSVQDTESGLAFVLELPDNVDVSVGHDIRFDMYTLRVDQHVVVLQRNGALQVTLFCKLLYAPAGYLATLRQEIEGFPHFASPYVA